MLTQTPPPVQKEALIDKLLNNNITGTEISNLSPLINEKDLSHILMHIYDLNERDILEIAALTGLMKAFDNNKNDRRNKAFTRKINAGFRKDPAHKVILAEGDSWFNYPIVLTDVIDALSMNENLAIYSLAKGGDWLLNMLTGRKYVEELSVLHPDYFLISGGGNDIVGGRRLAAIIQPTPGNEFKNNTWATCLLSNANTSHLRFDQTKFDDGVPYLSKDFFALLMFFHLQYFFLINGILNGGSNPKKTTKFPGITIITQGYDYPIPSLKKGFGIDPSKWYIPFVRLFLGHGSWLKTPLEIRGILEPEKQRNIMYAMIFLFNEMMIQTGAGFNKEGQRVFHIDSRDSVGEHGWTDELHPRPRHFLNTGRVFDICINKKFLPTYKHVYVVRKF